MESDPRVAAQDIVRLARALLDEIERGELRASEQDVSFLRALAEPAPSRPLPGRA